MKHKETWLMLGVAGLISGGLISIFVLGNSATTAPGPGEIVSESGIHWHPELEIYAKGQKIEIPPNVGIEQQPHSEVHTHEDLPKLHWEIASGPVTKNQIRLGAFFEVWKQGFSATQLLQYRSGSDGQVKMSVNGQPTTDFENYTVQDGDKIVIKYE